MKKLKLFGLLLIIAALFTAQGGLAQTPTDVFISQQGDEVSIYFTNPITGLSIVARIGGFSNVPNILEAFHLTPSGVLYQNPSDGTLRIVSANGLVSSLVFIPQQLENLRGISFALSEDGNTIAWAEMHSLDGVRFETSLFTASLNGGNLRMLPVLPVTQGSPFSRVAVLGVSNDASLVFFDLEQPNVVRGITDYFINYQSLWLYITPRQAYNALPLEPNCHCPAQIANDGRTFIRLERPVLGKSYRIHTWNLDNNTDRLTPAFDTIYQQGGDVLVSDDGRLVAYSMGGIEGVSANEVTAFALVVADTSAGEQRIINAPNGQRWTAMAFINENQELMIVDSLIGATYKLDIASGDYWLVADKIWLGQLSN
ncbi:MAG: hypothetical protein H6673_00635 [Anaerolineales bacterium]|nr:hypothetical protein [Anaerolineales bacterium]